MSQKISENLAQEFKPWIKERLIHQSYNFVKLSSLKFVHE